MATHEWEQVRLHAYHSEWVLAGSERLAPLAPLVGSHHERGDGSGYHRGCGRGDLPLAGRVLAAADAYQAMTQLRPHRPALTPEQAEEQLLADASAARLDADAVGGVLRAAGRDAEVRRELRRQPSWQARLAAAHTIPRELRSAAVATFDSEQAAGITVPTLLLVGSEGPDWQPDVVAAALPDARIGVLEGQDHVADLLAPRARRRAARRVPARRAVAGRRAERFRHASA